MSVVGDIRRRTFRILLQLVSGSLPIGTNETAPRDGGLPTATLKGVREGGLTLASLGGELDLVDLAPRRDELEILTVLEV